MGKDLSPPVISSRFLLQARPLTQVAELVVQRLEIVYYLLGLPVNREKIVFARVGLVRVKSLKFLFCSP